MTQQQPSETLITLDDGVIAFANDGAYVSIFVPLGSETADRYEAVSKRLREVADSFKH